MYRRAWRMTIIMMIMCTIPLLFIATSYAQSVKITVAPDVREITTGTAPIILRALTQNKVVKWSLSGEGKLSGDVTHPAITYIPPKAITGPSATVTIDVTVSNPEGATTTVGITFYIEADGPPPTPTPKGDSPWKKYIVVGAGAAAATVGLIVALQGGGNGDSDDCPGSECKNDWQHLYDGNYSGPVWMEIKPRARNNRDMPHFYRIEWGSWLYTGQITFSEDQASVALWHTKGVDSSPIELRFHIDPDCYVTFHQGNPPATAEDINSGWVYIGLKAPMLTPTVQFSKIIVDGFEHTTIEEF